MNGIVFLIGLGGSEIILILIVVLLLFGADKIPEFAKGIGKGMREFRKATEDIKREFENHTQDIKKDIEESTKAIESSVNNAASSMEEEDYGYTPYHEGSGNNDDPNYFLDPEEAELKKMESDKESSKTTEKEDEKSDKDVSKKETSANEGNTPEHPDPDFKS